MLRSWAKAPPTLSVRVPSQHEESPEQGPEQERRDEEREDDALPQEEDPRHEDLEYADTPHETCKRDRPCLTL